MRASTARSFVCKNSNVASATGVTKLLSADPARLGFSIYNDSSAILTLCLGSSADMTGGQITIKLAANGGYYEDPFGYVGEVHGQWATANGFARVADFR